MSWETSDRRSELPPDWPKLRAQVLKRDGHRCTWNLPKSGARCPRPATDVDHKVPGNWHGLENLRALCGTHHDQKSAKEGVAAKKKIKASGRRRTEESPGRIR